jgi:hypothetical protein
MRKTTSLILTSTLLLAGLAAAPAQAQVTCDDIDFTGQIMDRFPRANDACLAVVQRDGGQFAKFSAEVQRVRGNTIYAKFKLPDGSKTDTYSFDMPADARVEIGGRQYRYRDLTPKTELNVYLPEGRWEVHVPHSDDFATASTVAVATPMMAADAGERESDMVAMLPKTASPLPLIGMLGGLLTSLGLVLYGIRRRLG